MSVGSTFTRMEAGEGLALELANAQVTFPVLLVKLPAVETAARGRCRR